MKFISLYIEKLVLFAYYKVENNRQILYMYQKPIKLIKKQNIETLQASKFILKKLL